MNNKRTESQNSHIRKSQRTLAEIDKQRRTIQQKLGLVKYTDGFGPSKRSILKTARQEGIPVLPTDFLTFIVVLMVGGLWFLWSYNIFQLVLSSGFLQLGISIVVGFIAAIGGTTLIHYLWKDAAFATNHASNGSNKKIILANTALIAFALFDIAGVGSSVKKLYELVNFGAQTDLPIELIAITFISVSVPLLSAILGWASGLWEVAKSRTNEALDDNPDHQSALKDLIDLDGQYEVIKQKLPKQKYPHWTRHQNDEDNEGRGRLN